MAKVKVINNGLDQNLNGTSFTNITSETIFSFGRFSVTSNFGGRIPIDYTNALSTFVRPVTLATMGVSTAQSQILHDKSINTIPNLDKSNINTFIRFGSAYEFLRVAIQNIILGYPGSLYSNSNTIKGGNITLYDFSYNVLNDIAIFKIPAGYTSNPFGIIFNQGNITLINSGSTSNLNLSYDKFVVWSSINSTNTYPVIGFTGDTVGIPYILVKTQGNPFPTITGSTIGYINFHIKPNSLVFEEYRSNLSQYEQYIISQRETSGFGFTLSNPTLLEDGSIIYSNSKILWSTTDGYNIDINNSAYNNFLNTVLTIGTKYDSVKTDLIARFLTPASLKTYDLTQDGKMTKLLRTFGWEFDQLRIFIDSLVYVNTITYDKLNNIPDQLVSNLARTLGWNYFTLVNETELVDNFLSIDGTERNLKTDLLPAEVNLELWRRILNNTNYFWKSKGTRAAIKSIFLLIGIPEPFINITEYIYTVDGKIDPRSTTLTAADFPTNSLPYDTDGYPIAPLESNNYYFQMSGDSDSGQAYFNAFRKAGFNLNKVTDNRKSWIQTGSTTREDGITSQYYQVDSRLVLNTKEVGISLDTSRGVEYDVYDYLKKDYAINSSGYTLPISYVNISLGVSGSQNTFTLPAAYNKAEGDLEVRFNGILLNAPKEFSGGTGGTYSELTKADYSIAGNNFTILNSNYAINVNNRRDVVEATYIYSGSTNNPISGVTVKYCVSRIKANIVGTSVLLPSVPSGDVQLTINGIALTKGTGQFIADYILDPNNSNQLIIQNQEVIAYMVSNPFVQVAYVNVNGNSSVAARSEVLRIDSFTTNKLYFNNSANKYVYRLNYKMNDAREVKVLIDGIALEPQTDYSLNTNNKYELFLPKTLKYGNVISTYYLVAGDTYFNPIISTEYGLGDIENMSFLEFIEFIQKKLINATNRKTITDFKGGWYPTLLDVYVKYLKRSKLSQTNPLYSNGYAFDNLYQFLNKYNAFFQKFVDELLPTTIILNKSGLLIRNTVFTKQKFPYKRGVYMGLIKSISPPNMTFGYDSQLSYFGDDGSVFLKKPLVTNALWTTDTVCVDDLCVNLIVDNVVIDYSTNTTTTTQFPFEAMLLISEETYQEATTTSTQTGYYGYGTYTLSTTPSIMPGYTINIDAEFTSKNYITGGTGNESSTNITIIINGVQTYLVANQQTETNTGDTINSTSISMSSGDIIQIILEDSALKDNSQPSGVVSALSEFTLTVSDVLPNGNISSVIPPITVHTIPIP